MSTAASPALRLAGLRRAAGDEGLSLAQAAHHLAEHALPLLMILLAALAMVPTPGLPLGVLTGLSIAWLALGALSGRHAALPRRFAHVPLPRKVLDAALRRLVPVLRRIERLSRPRLPALVGAWGRVSVLGALGLQGLVLAVPLPFGNIAPATAVILLAVALLRRDGLGVMIGHAAGLASLAVIAGLGWSAWAVVG